MPILLTNILKEEIKMATFQSIFDDNVEAEKQFDTMFGAEEDDKLIEAVLMMNEDAAQNDTKLPGEEELHQTADEATPKDIADELGPNHDADKPTCDSSDQEIIADDDEEALDLACPKCGVQDGGQDKKDPDNEEIEDEIKANEKEIKECAALRELLEEAETDLGDNDGLGENKGLGDVDDMDLKNEDTPELTENEDKNEEEEQKDPVGESTSLVDALLEEADPEESVDKEYTEPEDDQGEPSVDNKAKAGAEGTDKDPVYESSLVDMLLEDGEEDTDDPNLGNDEGDSKEGEVKEASDDTVDGDVDADDFEDDDEDSIIESLLKEADEELPEKVEDELINDAEDAAELTDSEVDDIEDVYDDDLLDDVVDED